MRQRQLFSEPPNDPTQDQTMQEYPNGPSDGNKDTPLNFVVVNDELLLEHLDRIQAVCLLLLRQHDLSEVTLTEHSEEVEVVEADLPLPRGRPLLLLLLHHRLLLLHWGQRLLRRHARRHTLGRAHREGGLLLRYLWRWRDILHSEGSCQYAPHQHNP